MPNISLTSGEIESIVKTIEERGFVLVPSIISKETANQARELIHGYLEAEATVETCRTGTQRVGGIAVRHQLFRDLMCHPIVLAVWEHFLGEDCYCSTWSANTAYPGYNGMGWHVDYPYWSIEQPWPTGSITGQTVWLLDDFTEENGATAAVPYSHRLGCPPSPPTEQWRDDGEILTGARGSVVFAHGAWYHTARPNISDQSRTALLGMYLKPCFIPQEDMHGQLAEIENPSETVRKIMGGNQWQPRNVGA
ncbi:uncharacterized protein METZ01_LOCUS292017 [marine metagenome]|uniref:Fe2OG dioxygenase domain-containing protein n=1 Tax=marine metagenome TaxID=408172 RepID=A0A382LRW5_9ZZZZ